MPVINRVAEFHPEIVAWRRDLHQNPELLYDVHRTADKVANLLRSFGVDEVVTGIGRTGVVGVIKGRAPGKTVGLRADMDALPIVERTGKPYASLVSGKMHACGHDGHTAMLLGAARYLAETRSFDGTAVVIFQPAEEGGAGGRAMVDDGMMDRFGIEEVYGMHNMPGLPVGHFAIRKGAIMAATDEFTVSIKGVGGHAAMPHMTIDPIAIGAQIVSNLQLIASRSANPLKSVVVSVTTFNAGNAHNVIPNDASFAGTVRTLDPEMRDLAEQRFKQIVTGIATSHGAEVEIEFQRNYPVTFNHADETDHAIAVAEEIAGAGKVIPDIDPMMGGEDFSYMLLSRPGAFIFVGNGDTAGLHNPAYDFNDEAIAHGISYWVRLAEQRLNA